MGIIYPSPLNPGDKIAIVSPASRIDRNYVAGAVATLKAEGWNPIVSDHALTSCGSYSGTQNERYSDLENAFLDPEVKAIVCSRGGYGTVHLLDKLSKLPLAENPKWLIGFSDISALHALMATRGIASVHASMTKHLALGPEDHLNQQLFKILRGEKPRYRFEPSDYNRNGSATGTLLGGNIAVLSQLISTPFDILKPDTILFIEDIAEPIYKIERILYQLRLSGVLSQLRGLIVGKFTKYIPDLNYEEMEEMIESAIADYNYPVAFNIPVGHIDENVPLIESSTVTLTVSQEEVSLKTL